MNRSFNPFGTRYIFFILSMGLFAACGRNHRDATNNNGSDGNAGGSSQKIRIDTIATGFTNPWGMAFLPDGRVLITEKAGQIRVVQDGKLQPGSISGLPAVYATGQG